MIHPYFSGMKLMVEVKDSKAEFVLELLGYFPFVKVEVVKDRKPSTTTKNKKRKP